MLLCSAWANTRNKKIDRTRTDWTLVEVQCQWRNEFGIHEHFWKLITLSYPPEQCQCVRNARVGVRAWEHEIASKWVRFTLNAWDLRAMNNNNNSIIGLSSAFPIEDTPQLTNTYLGITNSWNPLAATAEGISAEENVLQESKNKFKMAAVKIQHKNCLGGRVGVVVRALAFHQCGPGSISALAVKCGLSLFVLYSAMRGFPPGTLVFPSSRKPTFDLIGRKQL